ncbi:MAG: hypothetical protein KA240_05240 [Nitrospira sp.]|nr:hypothetical protein [Nitrospira sp.]HQY56670.1 hypothetical protein [Nitrospira sp.]HRA95706.1 hypothetical protein [Nitrospira sp.]
MCKREPTGHRILPVFGAGTTIGVFVGSIGLGGAECQLPLLRHSFCFPPSESVILNRVRSLAAVVSAFIVRIWIIPFWSIAQAWMIVENLLGWSLVGAWVRAGVATRCASHTLHRVIVILLLVIALLLVFAHSPSPAVSSGTIGISQAAAGVSVGLLIGIVASILSVADNELLFLPWSYYSDL